MNNTAPDQTRDQTPDQTSDQTSVRTTLTPKFSSKGRRQGRRPLDVTPKHQQWIFSDLHALDDDLSWAERPHDHQARFWRALGRVRPGDTIFDLGDLYLGPGDSFPEWIAAHLPEDLNYVLIRGNHDRVKSWQWRRWNVTVLDAAVVAGLYLSHRGTQVLPDDAEGQLLGHYHRIEASPQLPHALRFSPEERDYAPVPITHLKDLMRAQGLLRDLPERADDCWHFSDERRRRRAERLIVGRSPGQDSAPRPAAHAAVDPTPAPELRWQRAGDGLYRIWINAPGYALQTRELEALNDPAHPERMTGQLELTLRGPAGEWTFVFEAPGRLQAATLSGSGAYDRLVLVQATRPRQAGGLSPVWGGLPGGRT